jgi:hypothetical protein
MTPDPYQGNSGGPGDPSDPQSWNRYAYTTGDPVNYNDPAGMAETEVDYGGGYPNDASFSPSFGLPVGPGPILVGPNNSWYQQYDRATTMLDSLTGTGLASNWSFVNGNLYQISLDVSTDVFDFGLLPVAAGAAGGTIIIAGGPVSWTVVAGVVVIVGASLAAVYVIDQVIEARKADLRQFDQAVRQYEKECGTTLNRDQRRRLHDAITGQGYGIGQIVEDAKALFGCPNPRN